MMRNEVIILAAGKSERMKLSRNSEDFLKSKNSSDSRESSVDKNSSKNKLLLLANEKPVIYYSLMAFNDHPGISGITLVVNKDSQEEMQNILDDYRFSKVRKVIIGGNSRQQSLEIAFEDLKKNYDKNDILVIVHNGANPLPSERDISGSIKKAKEHGACIVGHFLKSTIKEIDEERIIKTHDRTKLFAAETPQVVKMSLLEKALDHAQKNDIKVTDEAMLVEELGEKIYYLEADENNFKVTTEKDLKRLRQLVGEPNGDFRVGIGQDSHEFLTSLQVQNCPPDHFGLTLGGLFFPTERKMKANSDGDVIFHAAFNAISQAIGEKSLGFYADPMCEKGVTDSEEYLKLVLEKMRAKGLMINTLGVMLECKSPKIDPIVNRLKDNLAKIFDLPVARIGITATSGENLTSFGQGLGIQCFVIVSLVKG